MIWPDRPPDIYYYYAQNVGAMDNQGYSLHHATGWYLNFGYPGVALGGILLGLAWAFCLSARYRIGSRTGFLFCVYAQIAPWLFAAHLAPLLRAGPEAYKGMLVEGVLIPLGVLALACRPKRGNPRVVWTRERGWTAGSPVAVSGRANQAEEIWRSSRFLKPVQAATIHASK